MREDEAWMQLQGCHNFHSYSYHNSYSKQLGNKILHYKGSCKYD